MRKHTKIVLSVLCAGMITAASVMGTLAYLTSRQSVTNTFTVAGIQMAMDETDVDGSNTMSGYPAGMETHAGRDMANSYMLVPQQSYTKDPLVYVDSSVPCYVFVKVDNGLKNIIDGETIEAQILGNGWQSVDGAADVYSKQLTAEQAKPANSIPVFESFQVKSSVTGEELKQYADAQIDVTAYAIQQEGFDTVAQAWAEVSKLG